ncbi:NACHT, LRR and PYD domains-containing protein 3 [Misgurnus anguillicaudatus]|uniref:NACHT, LRR and PYD domains-containing protein 3 n=1 Tax=Misgurnus anguillicaudatus TaxID=75329 RepID=UPI003CCF204F
MCVLNSVYQKRLDADFSCMSMKNERPMDPPTAFKRPDATEPVCKKMKIDQPVNQPQYICPEFSHDPKFNEDLNTFKSNLKEKFQCLFPGTSKQSNPTLLNEIYTELNITEIKSGEAEETPIKCNDIFKPLPEQDKHIRSVLTNGFAGIGKTVSVQKFILDWAEEKENQDVHLIFPLPFREINLMKDKTLSLLDLLHLFFPETKEMEIFSDKYKVLFIFDGLDECRLSLDFRSSVRLCDVSKSISVDVMLTNLIKGNLFPSALIWITSRPAAADLIPSECVDRVTEVRGFSDPQKEEYFRKRISDESLSDQIISHLKSSRSLYIMCHIPVFCWISVTVLERILSKSIIRREIPKTLTQMYTHFLIIQTDFLRNQKDYTKNKEMIFKLGKLAFEQLMKGNLIFYDEDLIECGIYVADASVYLELFTQIFREEFGLCQRKVYSFVHLSIQEHLAALYVHFSNAMSTAFKMNPNPSILDVYQRAIDDTVKCKNGHLGLFLRFLLGLSLQSNQNLIPGLRLLTCYDFLVNEITIKYIKEKIRKNPSPEKSINLLHCLEKLGDPSLVEEVHKYLTSITLSKSKLSSYQWSALVSLMLTSKQKLKKLVMKTFLKGISAESLKVLKELLPVICESRILQLYSCNITEEGCVALFSALRSNPSHLRELNLSDNKLQDSGVKLLSAVLENPHCKLEILKLSQCNITVEGCAALTSALTSNPSHLRELNLSNNKIGDSGMEHLSAVLENPRCKLERLWLCCCDITDEGCVALSTALTSNPSHLRGLILPFNNLGDLGVKLLSAVLENPHCKLEMLRLRRCNIKDEHCIALTSALRSNPSHLKHLNLSMNDLGDSGVKLLSAVLENPDCKLEKLVLSWCNITDEGCAALTSALTSNPSHLRELNLSDNKFGDSGVKQISNLLKDPDCKLEILRLRWCNITDEGCAALSLALISNPSHLRELNLTNNEFGDSGMEHLSAVLENPQCKLQNLWLSWCNITAEGCAALTSALTSNPSHIKYLKLSKNNLGDTGVKLISDVLKNPQCKLEILKLSYCYITAEGCAALSSALTSNPSHLTQLNLSENKIGDLGVKLICDVLKDPQCKLKILRLYDCNITDEGCVALSSALTSNPSHLTELNLTGNNLGDLGVKLLSGLKNDPHYKLKKLRLSSFSSSSANGVKEEERHQSKETS